MIYRSAIMTVAKVRNEKWLIVINNWLPRTHSHAAESGTNRQLLPQGVLTVTNKWLPRTQEDPQPSIDHLAAESGDVDKVRQLLRIQRCK